MPNDRFLVLQYEGVWHTQHRPRSKWSMRYANADLYAYEHVHVHKGNTRIADVDQNLSSVLNMLLSKPHIPVQAARVGHRILVHHLLKRLAEQ
jgi:outer membrane receptor for ferric coprogen and ferric-rhodotorulic acid